MNLRLLDHPLDRKSVQSLQSAGVYIFLPHTRVDVERKVGSAADILTVLTDDCEVLYVGKAKQLNHRLQNYRRAGSSSVGEWQKASQLNERARTVLVIPTPTHLEACLLEIFLIRILSPELNFSSVSAGRLYFVLQDRLSRRLLVSSRKKDGQKVWGAVRTRSQARPAFEALSDGLEAYSAETAEFLLQPFYSRFGRSGAAGRLSLDVSQKHLEIVSDYLKGRQIGLIDAVWKAMKTAADAQQFYAAAQMRDRYLALRELQTQLKRSRQIIRRFRNATIKLPANEYVEQRIMVVHRFAIESICASNHSHPSPHLPAYLAILSCAVRQFRDELHDEPEMERLRVNFEFLRLMLWWQLKQPESFSTDL